MIHFVGKSGSGGGGGGGSPPPTATVNFNPPGGTYTGTSKSVTITITGATKLRWRINTGAYTTVNGTSTVVVVTLSQAGKTLQSDALSADGSTVLATRSAFYSSPEGGQ